MVVVEGEGMRRVEVTVGVKVEKVKVLECGV